MCTNIWSRLLNCAVNLVIFQSVPILRKFNPNPNPNPEGITKYDVQVQQLKTNESNSTIFYINTSCETFYNTQVLLTELRSDFTTCYREMDPLTQLS